jgi:hypothetical protein
MVNFKVSKSNYGEYTRNNANSVLVTVENGRDSLEIYFSYDTAVAFRFNGKLVVIRNYWSTTTGKHLNWIDNGREKDRLSQAVFETAFSTALSIFSGGEAECA